MRTKIKYKIILLQSGFPRSSLFIVLEAEAAFFYYQCKETKGYEKDMEVHVGKKYLVACLGGIELRQF